MNPQALEERVGHWAQWVNLLVPGAGLILVGRIRLGLLLGLLFAACGSFAIATILIFPDDFSRIVQAAAIALAAGTYFGTQVGWVRGVRVSGARGVAAERRRVLRETQECLARGEAARALATIEPLAAQVPDDLLVACRLAQALSAVGDVPKARAAWRRVRQLDQHGIYRQQVREAEQIFGREGARNH